MITNSGKNILAKYLIGQAPAYASHIAVGCGAKPLPSDYVFTSGDVSKILSKETLDFEMFRAPIVSRGYVNDNGVAKIVFTAELPTTERYEITELGVYSAGSNPSAGPADSKPLFVFSTNEKWEYHGDTTAVSIPSVESYLGGEGDLLNIVQASPVFSTNADNRTLLTESRILRYESCRYLNNIILMRGNDANLNKTVSVTNIVASGGTITYTTNFPHTLSVGDLVTVTGVNPVAYNLVGATVVSVPDADKKTFTVTNAATGTYVSGGSITVPHLIVNNGSHHIHMMNAGVDLSKNSPKDKLKLAFSLVNQNGETNAVRPDRVRLLVEFSSTDTYNSGSWSRFEIDIKHGDLNPLTGTTFDFATNRYVVAEKKLEELFKSSGFSWSSVNNVKVYASVFNTAGDLTGDFYVALDAIRLENLSSPNPLYGMTGYTVMKSAEAKPIVKLSNTTSLVEFRFAIDVGASTPWTS